MTENDSPNRITFSHDQAGSGYPKVVRSVRLPTSLVAALDRAAERDGTTWSEALRIRLEAALNLEPVLRLRSSKPLNELAAEMAKRLGSREVA